MLDPARAAAGRAGAEGGVDRHGEQLAQGPDRHGSDVAPGDLLGPEVGGVDVQRRVAQGEPAVGPRESPDVPGAEVVDVRAFAAGKSVVRRADRKAAAAERATQGEPGRARSDRQAFGARVEPLERGTDRGAPASQGEVGAVAARHAVAVAALVGVLEQDAPGESQGSRVPAQRGGVVGEREAPGRLGDSRGGRTFLGRDRSGERQRDRRRTNRSHGGCRYNLREVDLV